MSDFKAKMHQIHFLLPRPRWASLQLGELTVPPDPCLYLKGLLLRGWRETGEGRKGKGEGREGDTPSTHLTPIVAATPVLFLINSHFVMGNLKAFSLGGASVRSRSH